MFAQIKAVNEYWMKLDPTEQFMAWTVIGVMLSGALLVSLALIAPSIGGQYVPLVIMGVALGVVAIAGVFVSAVIYLTVIWPHHYAKYQERKEEKPLSQKVLMAIEDPKESFLKIKSAKDKIRSEVEG